LQSNEYDEELLERIALKSAPACDACGAEDCICSEQPAVVPSADVQSRNVPLISTVNGSHEPKGDSPQQPAQRTDGNQTGRETDGSTQAIGHTFRDILSICLLEVLDDRTLCGAFLAFGSLMLSITISITHNDYDQVKILVDPCFRAMAVFLVVRQILCWIIRRSRSQKIRKAALFETLVRNARQLSNFAMVTLVFTSVCLRLTFPAVFLPGSQFVWTVNGHSIGTPLLDLTAVSIVAVIVQEIWAFVRSLSINNAEGKESWKTRINSYARTFSMIFDVSFAAMSTIAGAMLLLFWSDFIWFSGATVVAQSLRDHDQSNAVSWADSFEKTGDCEHAAETKYLIAFVDVSAGNEKQAQEHLNQALSDLRNGKPNQRLQSSILHALAELSQRPNIEQEVSPQSPGSHSGTVDSESNKSYNLIYGPFVLNLQMQDGTPRR
jgi:hypothetical protein